jgi:hypothetical protein
MLADIVLQAFATPKPSHRTATRYSVIQHPKSHDSSCPLSNGATLYSTLGGAYMRVGPQSGHCTGTITDVLCFRWRLAFSGEIFGLWAAARPWILIPLNSRRTVMVLAGQFVALRKSRVIVSLHVWRVSRTTFFNARRSLSVIKRGLPGRGFVVVVPSYLHFTTTSPTIDLGNMRRVAVSLTDSY